MENCFPIRIKRCGRTCCHRHFVLKVRRKYGIIKAWKNIDGAVGNTNVCRVNNGLQPINKRLKEQLIVTAMKKRRLQRQFLIRMSGNIQRKKPIERASTSPREFIIEFPGACAICFLNTEASFQLTVALKQRSKIHPPRQVVYQHMRKQRQGYDCRNDQTQLSQQL
mgnify:CR=1 FL=1